MYGYGWGGGGIHLLGAALGCCYWAEAASAAIEPLSAQSGTP